MPTSIITTLYSFYSHNASLVFFGGMAMLTLLLSLRRPSRFYILLFIGFTILTLNFEYDKHLFVKIKTDMLDLMFPAGTRFRKYNLLRYFLEFLLPIILDIVGWGLVALAIIFGKPRKKVEE